MQTGATPPVKRARSIFDDLGYEVRGDGPEFTARRKWRSVRVTATADGTDPGDDPDADLRCFVTWAEDSSTLRDRLRRRNPDYEWAIIGVRDDGDDYEVLGADAVR